MCWPLARSSFFELVMTSIAGVSGTGSSWRCFGKASLLGLLGNPHEGRNGGQIEYLSLVQWRRCVWAHPESRWRWASRSVGLPLNFVLHAFVMLGAIQINAHVYLNLCQGGRKQRFARPATERVDRHRRAFLRVHAPHLSSPRRQAHGARGVLRHVLQTHAFPSVAMAVGRRCWDQLGAIECGPALRKLSRESRQASAEAAPPRIGLETHTGCRFPTIIISHKKNCCYFIFYYKKFISSIVVHCFSFDNYIIEWKPNGCCTALFDDIASSG